MRIVIDMQGAQSESRFRGIGRYSLSLALAIAKNADEDDEIWLALNASFPESILDIREIFKDLIPQEHIRIFKIPLPVKEIEEENRVQTRVAELLYEDFLEQLKPDKVLISSLFDEGYSDSAIISVGKLSTSYKTVAILYDLIPFLDSKNYLPEKNIYDYYMRRVDSLKKVDLLLSISESSKKEAIEALEISKDKIVNISTAVDETFKMIQLEEEAIQALYKKYNITRKMVMYAPGGFDKRKNFKNLIEAYSLLPKTLREEYQLVIVSKIQEDSRYELNNFANRVGLLENELILTGYVSNKDLIALYTIADLFVFPSRHEGFGLPVLEAMSCGAPVIGSNTTSIPEVIGLDEALFNPDSIESIKDKIQEALESTTFREKLRVHAKKQVTNFSWDKSATLALESMHSILPKERATLESSDLIESIAKMYSNLGETENNLIQTSLALEFNTAYRTPKQLLLDISVLVHVDAKSGIQRVVRSLLLEIVNNKSLKYSVKPIYSNNGQYYYANRFIAKFLNRTYENIEDDAVSFRQDDIYLSLDLNAHLTNDNYQLYKQLQILGIKIYFIVYDILFVQNPSWWVENVSKTFNLWLRNITEVATGLICISESVANEVKEWIDKNPTKRVSILEIKSFHLGADINSSVPSKGLSKDSKNILEQINLKPSFLMVGTIEPRKGHLQTLEAFEKLWAEGEDILLIIVGKEGWLVDDLITKLRKHSELNKRLFWLEGISDEYLEKIYATSDCLIAGSEGEGFGLPLIEAAQKKMPIIARDLPVFREVAGEYAYYFENTKNPLVIANTIRNWLQLHKENRHPKSDNMPWLTWEESTEQLLKCLNINSTYKDNH